MTKIKQIDGTRSEYECDYCKDHVVRRTDSGNKGKHCGEPKCQRAYIASQSTAKYIDASIMEIIEDKGFVGDKGHLVEYQCPYCTDTVTLPIAAGSKQKSCGKKKCVAKTYKDGTSADVMLEAKRVLKRKFRTMLERCNEPTNKAYKWYGAKGIKVEWETFEDFYNDMGKSYTEEYLRYLQSPEREYKDVPSIDRIDSDLNYCAGNCEWIPFGENAARKNDEYLPIVQLDYNMNLIEEWDSARDAARVVSDIKYVDKIKSVCNLDRNEHAGYVWRWSEDYVKVNDNALWEKVLEEGCSKDWRVLETFEAEIPEVGEGMKLMRENINKPWSKTNVKVVASDYVRNDSKQTGAVNQIDKKTGELVATFSSAKEANEVTGIANISLVLRGKRKSSGGFRWEFVA